MHHSLCWNSITYTIHVKICMHVIAFNIPICYTVIPPVIPDDVREDLSLHMWPRNHRAASSSHHSPQIRQENAAGALPKEGKTIFSVTAGFLGGVIPDMAEERIGSFFRNSCRRAFAGRERGGIEDNLYWQIALETKRPTSPQAITQQLIWGNRPPQAAHILVSCDFLPCFCFLLVRSFFPPRVLPRLHGPILRKILPCRVGLLRAVAPSINRSRRWLPTAPRT
jgi:hypothetical protein